MITWNRKIEMINGVPAVTDCQSFDLYVTFGLRDPFVWVKSEPGAFRPSWSLRLWPLVIHYSGRRTR